MPCATKHGIGSPQTGVAALRGETVVPLEITLYDTMIQNNVLMA